MPTIAIVDDETKYRNADVKGINRNLPNGWSAIGTAPLERLTDYPSWIAENDVAVLIVDEELGNRSASPTGHVRYKGHDLVQSLRARNKTLPIYFLTNYANQKPVKDHIPAVEGVFDKKLFRRDRADYVKRLTRRGKDYFNSVRDQLADLNTLSLKIAKGEATAKEKNDARAIQTSLELPLLTESFNTRSEWLGEYDKKVKEFEALKKQVQKYLQAKPRKAAKKR
jgi:DNA-binding NarL/FixJ family response regulator